MATFLLSLTIIGAAVAALAIGVINGREPIRGSCGGLACVPGAACEACGKEKAKPR